MPIEAMTGYEALFFMVGYSGCNLFKMHLEDEKMTTFLLPKGVFYYKVMSFSLKNSGAASNRSFEIPQNNIWLATATSI